MPEPRADKSSKATAPAERPARLSLSEVLRMMLERSQHDRSSVTLSRLQKGETKIEVTVRTGDDGDVTTPEDAERRAVEIYERLRGRYPLPSGYVGAEHEPANG